jgi:hypothetical protein
MQVKCWTIRDGWTAPKAAGTIHTDFERGFIKAEVYNYKVRRGSDAQRHCLLVESYGSYVGPTWYLLLPRLSCSCHRCCTAGLLIRISAG